MKTYKNLNFFIRHSIIIFTLWSFNFNAFSQEPNSSIEALPKEVEKTKTETLTINLGKAGKKESILSFPELKILSKNKNSKEAQEQLEKFIIKNLSFTHFFKILEKSSFRSGYQIESHLMQTENVPDGFKFEDWTDTGSEFLIKGYISKLGKTKSVSLYLYHVPNKKLIFEKEYNNADLKSIADEFSNDLMFNLTGKSSIFKTKIVFASDNGSSGYKEIFISDWDGSNLLKISDHKSISLSPNWSADKSKIAYSAFTIDPRKKIRNPNLYVYDLNTKKRILMSARRGMNTGAVFFPDNNKILMTLSAAGSPDIYQVGLDGHVQTQITKGPFGAMNVEPTISSDAKKIAFSSDRSGKAMIYTLSIDPAGESKRITMAGSYNSSPSWSPDGNQIVFAGRDKTHFDIFLMNADGTNMQRLTQIKKSDGSWASNEYPSFSPDGRYIVFQSNRTGKSQIYITDLEANFVLPITNDNFNYFQPKWSGF